MLPFVVLDDQSVGVVQLSLPAYLLGTRLSTGLFSGIEAVLATSAYLCDVDEPKAVLYGSLSREERAGTYGSRRVKDRWRVA